MSALISNYYECYMCNATLPFKTYLIIHMGFHTEKPFPCRICSTRLFFKNDANRHMKKVHRLTKWRIHIADFPKFKFSLRNKTISFWMSYWIIKYEISFLLIILHRIEIIQYKYYYTLLGKSIPIQKWFSFCFCRHIEIEKQQGQ